MSGARSLLVASFAARLPTTMIGLALVLATRDSGFSYAIAGAAAGAFTLGLASTGPLIARLAERSDAARTVAIASVSSGTLLGAAALAGHARSLAMLAAALLAGAALPPAGAITRARITHGASADERRGLYAFDATAQEVLFTLGPVVLTVLVALWAPVPALGVVAGITVVGGLVFARKLRSQVLDGAHERRSGPLPIRSAPFRIVLAGALLVGWSFGGIELSVTAALEAAGSRNQSGLVLAVWTAASALGGLTITRFGPRAPAARLPLVYGGMLLASPLLVLAATSPVLLAAALVLHGIFIAPSFATMNEVVASTVEARQGEAFAWLSAAIISGISLGTATAGLAVHAFEPRAGFALVAVVTAGALAFALATPGPSAHPA